MNKISISVALCGLGFVGANAADNKPNIILVLADDLGYGDVSYNNPYSRVQTPAIDALAKGGITFTDAHSAGALSGPSRYGLVTGRYHFRLDPRQEILGYLGPKLEAERRTIGTLMQDAGYKTACVGKWHLGLEWGLKDKSLPQVSKNQIKNYTNTDFTAKVKAGPYDRGFDYSFIMPASLDMPPYVFVRNQDVVDPEIVLTGDVYKNVLDDTVFSWDRKNTGEKDIYWKRGVWWRNGEMSESFKVEDCMTNIVDEGLDFIERSATNENPFFLYLPLTGPHTPWMPTKEFKDRSGMGTYGDFIMEIDNVISQIQAKLVELGEDDNTIIIFTSDNGAAWRDEDIYQYSHMANYGRRGQKGDAHDGGHRVPLFIYGPEHIAKGKSYEHTVNLVDIFATFAELTGQELREGEAEDSFSFYPVLKGKTKKASREDVIYIAGSNKLAIKKGDWKYIDCLGSGGFTQPSLLPIVKGGPKGQLYNMSEDIFEKNNLYFSEIEKAEELKALLNKYIEQGQSRE